MEAFKNAVGLVNTILWDYILIFGLIGVGIYLTVRLKFPQFSRLFPALKKMIGDIVNKKPVEEGKMTPFQALSTAVAAQVGTGNIVGVATAIAAGGPGAAFWMLVSAFFGMATIFAEAVLAQKYRKTEDGELVGGPAYYIKNGLKSKGLAAFFAVSIIIALGFIGNMVQSNSIATAVSRAFNIPNIAVGFIIAILAGLIFIGGMKRIARFAEMVVPVMAVIYILGAIVVVILFRGNIIPTFKSIFVGAFSPQAVFGGAAGIGIKQAVRYGIARGLFSNEAGMGSTPNSHAVADVEHPAEQGLSAMIAVFIDTILVCTATSLVILSTGAHQLGLEGAAITQEGFNIAFGTIGEKFLAVCLTFFAFTTVVGWYYFGENNIRFLFKGKTAIRAYQIIVLVFIVLGSYQKVDFVWNLADMFNGIMVIPNLIALLFLYKESKGILLDYDTQMANGGRLQYNYEFESTRA